MIEIYLLRAVLIFGYIIGPFFTNHFFLKNRKIYSFFHIVSIIIIIFAILFRIPQLNIVWLFFCGFGIILLLKIHWSRLLQDYTWTKLIPLGFSFLSAIWFFSGSNHVNLLGYNEIWSYYAAIHGCFIGWLFLMGVTVLLERNPESKIYPILILCIVILFLMIAFGIFGNLVLKKMGVIGYSVLLPFSLIYRGQGIRCQNPISKYLFRCSFIFLCFTLLLALLHEFYSEFPKFIYGIPMMVLVHGSLNSIIVIPCFLGSLLMDEIK
ncbi:hypothetical protein EHQ30_13455 [Leptospira brenneri]|uniref:Uncharacterized protein n=1 Tax=Leptospira brenneri TaxID=2023182 RepID=A0A5F1Z4F9_9LEPT|nr:hypothetical protein EHQ30_13455 [Leptospira brenneri]